MNKKIEIEPWFKKMVGNFLVAFSTSYTALVTLDSSDRSLIIALVIAFMQGLLACGKYLLIEEPIDDRKKKKSEMFFVF
jgi:hypothetical protein